MSQVPPDDTAVESFDPFKALREFDSAPAVPVTDAQKVRLTTLAELLGNARVQAYIEANFGLKMLELLKIVLPLLLGAL